MNKKLRKYTKKRLNSNFFKNIFRSFSITSWIIFANLLVFIILQFLIIFLGDKIISHVALQANYLFSGRVWTLLTSMFSHFEVWHLLANMVSLFFIGNFVERLIGRKRFFWLYLFSGIFAGLFYTSLSYFFGFGFLERIFLSPNVFAVGASGAIFSLLGLLAILTPHNKVYLIAGPLISIICLSVFSFLFPGSQFIQIFNFIVYFYLIFSVFAIFSFRPAILKIAFPVEMPFWFLPLIAIVPLVVVGLFVPLPIGNTAHLGGLIAGLIYGVYL